MYCLNMLGMLPYDACAVYLLQRHSCLIGCVTGRECMHGLEKGYTRDGRQTCSFWKSALAEGLGSSEDLALGSASAVALPLSSAPAGTALLPLPPAAGCFAGASCSGAASPCCGASAARHILECCSYGVLNFMFFLGLRQDSRLFSSL